MIRTIVKRNTDQEGEAVQLSPATLQEVIRWTGGFQVEEIDPETDAKLVAVLYDTSMGRKRVSEGNWLVRFRGEWFEATPQSFAHRFEVRSY